MHQIVFLLFIGLIAGLSGCSDSDEWKGVIDLEASQTNLRIGEGATFSVTQYQGDKATDVTDKASCTVSGSGGLTISESTVIASAAGQSMLNCSINGATTSLTFSVADAELVYMLLVDGDTTLHRGAIGDYSLQGTYSDGETRDLTAYARWGSTSPTIASVIAGKVSALNIGRTEIEARVLTLLNSADVEVILEPPINIEIRQDEPFAVGDERRFSAWGTWADGDEAYMNDYIVWTASNGNAEYLGEQYRVNFRAVAAGPVTISANYEGIQGDLNVVVEGAALRGVYMAELESETIILGESMPIKAYARYSDGSERDISGLADWHQNTGATNAFSFQLLSPTEATVTGEDLHGVGYLWPDYDGYTGYNSARLLRVNPRP